MNWILVPWPDASTGKKQELYHKRHKEHEGNRGLIFCSSLPALSRRHTGDVGHFAFIIRFHPNVSWPRSQSVEGMIFPIAPKANLIRLHRKINLL